MTSRDFCFWLQGYLEISSKEAQDVHLSKTQMDCVQKHLNLVFKQEIDPSMGDQAKQTALNELHGPGTLLRC